MRIFVSGGAGFIGSNLVRTLLKDGHEIKVLDNLSTGRIENIDPFRFQNNFEFIKGNVANRETVRTLTEWADQVYHLAAPVGVKYIMDNPVLTILDNVRGIDCILEAAKDFKKRVMVASTSEVYGRNLDFLDPTGVAKLNEEDYRVEGSTQNHRWAYANTKALDEFLSLAYFKQYGTEVVVVRFFNTVGPQQLSKFGMVIPNFVEKALRGESVTVYGSGEQKRSFMHVSDAIRAVRALMETGKGVGKVYNVGNPFEVTINFLAERIIELTGSKSKLEHISYETAYGSGFEDMMRRTADITRLKETLDFEIEYDLDAILKDVIEYKASTLNKV
ncbi:MAG TPA: NAD-dependent epimerase/dehydratase family protein [Bacteroidetes bacterium]|nr:NAD-dependent epimerase/dehydratase family protein [Bacteroidota bacterium]